MKTEELLSYEAEFKAMREVFRITLLIFEFSSQAYLQEKTREPHGLLRGSSFENHKRCLLNQTVSKDDELKPVREGDYPIVPNIGTRGGFQSKIK